MVRSNFQAGRDAGLPTSLRLLYFPEKINNIYNKDNGDYGEGEDDNDNDNYNDNSNNNEIDYDRDDDNQWYQ